MRWRALAFGALLASCSFLTSFDPEGQPCDKAATNPALSCLSDAGYWCVNGLCKKGPGPGGGSDGGVDAGPADGGADGGNLSG